MIDLRRSEERGHSRTSWLHSRHSFSFAHFLDPAHMGFRDLRVLNDDRVAPGAGFGAHPHRDMEILTLVLDGELSHRDDAGHAGRIAAGGAQAMSAGTGVVHSERNASNTRPLHLLQIWIRPSAPGLAPRYAERPEARPGPGEARWVAAPDGRDGAFALGQDATLEWIRPRAGDDLARALRPGRSAWLQLIAGEVELAGRRLAAGDGAAVTGESALEVRATDDSELLLFDLA
ncbi:MAG: pirin family protein [Myxococcota bacterium]